MNSLTTATNLYECVDGYLRKLGMVRPSEGTMFMTLCTLCEGSKYVYVHDDKCGITNGSITLIQFDIDNGITIRSRYAREPNESASFGALGIVVDATILTALEIAMMRSLMGKKEGTSHIRHAPASFFRYFEAGFTPITAYLGRQGLDTAVCNH